MAVIPYLTFKGNCREAMSFYAEVFGTELEMIMTAGEMPDWEAPDEVKDLIAHCSFRVAGGEIYASDMLMGEIGDMDGMSVMVSLPDKAAAKDAYDKLSAGGEVSMEFQETFWSPGFGTFRDKYGTPWMISTDMAEGNA